MLIETKRIEQTPHQMKNIQNYMFLYRTIIVEYITYENAKKKTNVEGCALCFPPCEMDALLLEDVVRQVLKRKIVPWICSTS